MLFRSVDLNGGPFGCTLEEFQAGTEKKCLNNDATGDYNVDYNAVPRPGWKFSHWDGTCAPQSEGDNCRFDVPAIGTAFWDQTFPDTPVPTLTAVFVEIIPPVADAGEDQTVEPDTTVTLDASGSTDADGDIQSYSWTQTGGTVVAFEIGRAHV